MSAARDCPEIESWQQLFAGSAGPEQRADYERHLESCPLCQERLDRAEEPNEPLRQLVQRVGNTTRAAGDPTLERFLEQLHEGKCLERPATEEPADLYFLRPSGNPDILGTLGEYEVQEVIGQGGFGVVLKAYEPALHRLVAIKVLAAAVAGSALVRRRFTREAQAAAAVCHEHIVPVYGVHETEGLPYLVMQYVAGESLQDRLDRTGPLEVEEIVRIGLQTAQGLAAAHAQGLIHRDIKPANLLLENGGDSLHESHPTRSASGLPKGGDSLRESHPPLAERVGYNVRVKITDFGLARMVDDIGLTQTGVVAGTPEYMAPEQARGEPIDHRADLFSLGSVLYALCTGRPPFHGAGAVAVLRQVSDQEPTPIRSLKPDVPAWLEALIARLLTKDPADRFVSAAEVAGLLESYLAHLGQPRTLPAPPLPPPPAGSGTETAGRWPHRFWLPMLVGLAALGPALLLLAQGLQQPAEPAPPPKQPALAEVYQDFRGGKPLLPFLKAEGPDYETVTRAEERGLRITLPGMRENYWPVGVMLTFPLTGDFQLTGSYEVLSAKLPAEGYGVGVCLSVATDHDRRKFGKIARLWHPRTKAGNGSIYGAESWNNELPKPDHYKWKPQVAEGLAGQLRLVREGPLIRYQAAEESTKDFQTIVEWPLGTDELALVCFDVIDSGSPGNRVEARLVDLRISTPQPIPAAAPEPAAAPLAEPIRPARSRVWLIAALLLLSLLLSGALAMYVALRNRRHLLGTPAKAQPGPLAAPAALVSVPCAACRKDLQVRPELAGKKVKCPRYGKPTLVPGIKAKTAPAHEPTDHTRGT